MTQNRWLIPEGFSSAPECYTLERLQQAMEKGDILTGTVLRCDAQQTLTVRLGHFLGQIPREECVAPFLSGASRDIAVLSCVGRTVSFIITDQLTGLGGETIFLLSRRKAQEKAMDYIIKNWLPGTVVPAQITHLSPFGAFIDVGCGVISMIPLSEISVSRIRHPAERFSLHQRIYVRIDRVDAEEMRIYPTHRELLGTWSENAAQFHVGETVTGIIRTQKEYGIFVELTPNLCGLADLPLQSIPEGRAVSVFIKSILPEKEKIKLQIVQVLDAPVFPTPLHYHIPNGRVEKWSYSPIRP